MSTAEAVAIHPVRAAMERARLRPPSPDDEPLTPEQREECTQALEDIRSGRVQCVRHEDVPTWLEARVREELG